MMHRHRGFTFKDMLVLLLIGVVLVVLVVMFYSPHSHRHTAAMRVVNNSHLKMIQQGNVLFAQANNGHYPGVMADGLTIDPKIGLTAQGRVQALLDDTYIFEKQAVNPFEEQTGVTSYAMLQINHDPLTHAITQGGRNSEWQVTSNKLAPTISDRAIVTDTPPRIESPDSLANPTDTGWRGSVAWSDGHVSMESSPVLTTRYGETDHTADNLFETTGDTQTGDDAFMVWRGTDEL